MNYSYTCRCGHDAIGHENADCPLCKMALENANLKARLEDMQAKARKILEHSWGLPAPMLDVMEEIADLLEFDPEDPKRITERQYQITLEDVMAALDGCDMSEEQLLAPEVKTAVEFRKLLDAAREDRNGWERAYFRLKGVGHEKEI
jgi:hypothetical protein